MLFRSKAKIDSTNKILWDKIDSVQKEVGGKIDSVQKEVGGKIDSVQSAQCDTNNDIVAIKTRSSTWAMAVGAGSVILTIIINIATVLVIRGH